MTDALVEEVALEIAIKRVTRLGPSRKAAIRQIGLEGGPWGYEKRAAQALIPIIMARAAGWEPIERAPRDGTRIIVAKWAWVHRSIDNIFDSDGEKIWHLCFATTAHWLPDRGYWTDSIERLVEPTHFMHLPAPPAQRLEEGRVGG